MQIVLLINANSTINQGNYYYLIMFITNNQSLRTEVHEPRSIAHRVFE